MSIQRSVAVAKGIDFVVSFDNISEDVIENCEIFEISCDTKCYSPIIRSDKQRIMQVLLGLQSNALKHIDTGKIEIAVKIVEKEDAQYLHIDVIDTGFGIPFED